MADAINRLALYLYLCCCSQWASNPALFIILNHDADIADTADANSIQGLRAPGTVEGDLQYRSQTQSEPQATYDTGSSNFRTRVKCCWLKLNSETKDMSALYPAAAKPVSFAETSSDRFHSLSFLPSIFRLEDCQTPKSFRSSFDIVLLLSRLMIPLTLS